MALTDPQGRAHPLIMIGPVAILPERQGQGFGRALMAAQRAAIEAVREEGATPLPQVLIGDEPYYGKFGFVEAEDGTVYVIEDGAGGRLLKLTPQ